MCYSELYKVLFALALFCGGALGTVNAGPITYTDTYNAGNIRMTATPLCLPLIGCSGVSSVSWTFNILNHGYDPAVQDVTSAMVALHLQDDGGLLDFFEYASLNVGSNIFSFQVTNGLTSFTLNSLLILSSTGVVDATLTATGGDFFFKSATLTANAVDKILTSTNPNIRLSEPATLTLLAIAFIGLAYTGKHYQVRSL